MKKLILILISILFISCSTDTEIVGIRYIQAWRDTSLMIFMSTDSTDYVIYQNVQQSPTVVKELKLYFRVTDNLFDTDKTLTHLYWIDSNDYERKVDIDEFGNYDWSWEE